MRSFVKFVPLFLLAVGIEQICATPRPEPSRSQTRKRVTKRLFQRDLTIPHPHPNGIQIAADKGNFATTAQYNDLRNASIELLRRHPPGNSFFVSMGRDPTPIFAFLQELGGTDLAINFPASGRNQVVPAAEFAEIFEHFVSPEILASGKNIVLVDQNQARVRKANDGALPTYGPAFEAYLAAKGHSPSRVKLVSFTGQAMGGKVESISTAEFKDVNSYNTGVYEGAFSELPRFAIAANQGLVNFKKTLASHSAEGYMKFRSAIREHMIRDSVLDDFLATLEPDDFDQPDAPEPVTNRAPSLIAAARKAGAPKIRALAAAPNALPATALLSIARASGDSNGAPFEYLDDAQYSQLRDGTVTLLRKVDPNTHYFIGLGRSSAAITAILETAADDLAAYLPMDSLHKYVTRADGNVEQAVKGLSKKRRAAFYEIFDKFLPPEVLNGQRTPLLFHHSSSGQSLRFAQLILNDYLKLRGVAQPATEVYAFTQNSIGLNSISTQQDPELAALGTDKYFAVAPFEAFRPGSSANQDNPAVNPLDANGAVKAVKTGYTVFKTSLQRRMAVDFKLQAALQELIQQ